MFEGENFHVFCSFSLNRECFPTNYGLVDWQCKSTSMLLQKFSNEWKFCTLTVKVLPYTVVLFLQLYFNVNYVAIHTIE